MYKVVREDLTSFNSGNLQYKINKWVKPEYGKLFVFDTIENAKEFLSEYRFRTYHIYRCKVKGYVEPFLMLRTQNGLDYVKAWACELDTKIPAPKGTWVCDAVKLKDLMFTQVSLYV